MTQVLHLATTGDLDKLERMVAAYHALEGFETEGETPPTADDFANAIAEIIEEGTAGEAGDEACQKDKEEAGGVGCAGGGIAPGRQGPCHYRR